MINAFTIKYFLANLEQGKTLDTYVEGFNGGGEPYESKLTTSILKYRHTAC